MAYPVQGRDVLFEVYSDVAVDYVAVTCAESVTINFTPELVEKTTVSTGAGYDWHERRRGWDINLTGVSDIFSEGRTIFTMVNPDNINATYLIRLSFEDSLGNTAVFTGSAKLDAASINAIVGDLSDFDLNMRGIGVYELLQTIDGVSPPMGIGLMSVGSSFIVG